MINSIDCLQFQAIYAVFFVFVFKTGKNFLIIKRKMLQYVGNSYILPNILGKTLG